MSMEVWCIFNNFSNLDIFNNWALPYYVQVAFGLSSSYLLNVIFLLFSYLLHQ